MLILTENEEIINFDNMYVTGGQVQQQNRQRSATR